MDYNKLRYDLALQAATVRLMKTGRISTDKTDSEELLEIFSACYDDTKKISDQTIKDLLHD